MRLLVRLSTNEEGIIVGYAPGRKGRPLAIVLVDTKLRSVKLRQLKVLGYAKLVAGAPTSPQTTSDLLHWSPEGHAQ